MGSRNLDRITIGERRRGAETISDMWKGRWKVRAYCESCTTELRVDLEAMVRLLGPGFVLWNRTTRCRAILTVGECSGRVFFKGMPPGASGFEYLGTPPRMLRPKAGPMSGGRGAYLNPEDIEPTAMTATRGPSPPEPGT